MAKNTFKRIRAHHLDRFDDAEAVRSKKPKKTRPKTNRDTDEWDDDLTIP
jgi:hypothetical protein